MPVCYFCRYLEFGVWGKAWELHFGFVQKQDSLLLHYLSSSRDLLSHPSPTVLPVVSGTWESRKSQNFCDVSMIPSPTSRSIPQIIHSPHGKTECKNFICPTFPKQAHCHPPTAPHISLQNRGTAAIAQRCDKGNANFFCI